MIISSAQKGPLRVVIEAHGGALALFSKGHRNKATKIALKRGGDYWLAVWMPRRFSKYAFFLGYRAGKRWNDIKRRYLGGEPTPYVGLTQSGGGNAAPGYSQINAAKMRDSVTRAHTTSVGIAGRESITIRVPYGHPIRTEDSLAFKRLPQREMRLMANEVAAELGRIISAATPPTARAGKRAGSSDRRVSAKVVPRLVLGGKYVPRKK